jgi:hypothetical protein
MMRGAIGFVVLPLLLCGCTSLRGTNNAFELQVAGPPIEASLTGQGFLYTLPKDAGDQPDGGAAAQKWSMLGREDKSAKTVNAEYGAIPCSPLAKPEFGLDAIIDTISKRAASHRIVIVNESHTVTRHREFTQRLLPKLRALGFTVFAAETFGNDAQGETAIKKYANAGWVHRSEGYYSREPVFGRLVRSAKSLGFRLAAYEEVYDPNDKTIYSVDERIERRETAQAQNLASLLQTMGREEKLLIHVGYSHAREIPVTDEDTGLEKSWMAARLKALTGLDPLTLNQTDCRSDGGSAFLAKPESESFDIIISHPVDQFKNQRPIWRRESGDVEITIPLALRPTDQPLVVEAFVEGEPFDSVPIDRVLVEPGETTPLLLPPGRYIVRAVMLQKE